jgi:hypothetical protein
MVSDAILDRKEIPTAVPTGEPSVTSDFPPGRATWPAWCLRCFDRVVSKIRICPSRSYKRTSTAASLLIGNLGLDIGAFALAKRGF